MLLNEYPAQISFLAALSGLSEGKRTNEEVFAGLRLKYMLSEGTCQLGLFYRKAYQNRESWNQCREAAPLRYIYKKLCRRSLKG